MGKSVRKNIYAAPKLVASLDECDFYHVMDIPGHGVVGEEWDLRQTASQYLGDVNFKGKRVLELGTASGFLCFHMEKEGAEVVAYDLSVDHPWDFPPLSQYDYESHVESYREHTNRLNNAYWLAH